MLRQGLPIVVSAVRSQVEVQELSKGPNKSEVLETVQDMLSSERVGPPTAYSGGLHVRARHGGDESGGGFFKPFLGNLEYHTRFQDVEGFPLLEENRPRVCMFSSSVTEQSCVVSNRAFSPREKRSVPQD
jgi:hypothetical protein